MHLIGLTVMAYLTYLQVDDQLYGEKGKFGCIVDHSIVSKRTWKNYTLVVVLVQYCVPLSVITFCHCHMAKVSYHWCMYFILYFDLICRFYGGPKLPVRPMIKEMKSFQLINERFVISQPLYSNSLTENQYHFRSPKCFPLWSFCLASAGYPINCSTSCMPSTLHQGKIYLSQLWT